MQPYAGRDRDPAASIPRVGGGRDERIDALRGFALLGILLVNIQSFLWGGINPAGYLLPDADALDHLLFFFTVTFVNLKFMPLFALLFGVSFALLLGKLAAMTPAPHAVFRRRMLFLFVFGVLHGVLLYYGDITHLYALAGMVLLHYADADAQALRRPTALWWGGAIVLTVVLTGLVADEAPGPVEIAAGLEDNFAAFTRLGYWAQLPYRLGAFADIVLANVVGLPLVVALMLTGMLAQRAGWLARPAARAWTVALALGFGVGLPAAVAYGALLHREAATSGLGAYSLIAGVPGLFSVVLAFAYAALFVRHAPRWLIKSLAPAGRMPLSNYLLQSLAMGSLLSGWGLALGPQLDYADMTLLGTAIFGIQVALSHWWLRHWSQGPLEAAWRRWTYRAMPPH